MLVRETWFVRSLRVGLNRVLEYLSWCRLKQVCITAGDYEASVTTVEMMAEVGLQPEAEQERRMLTACFDPSQRKRDRKTSQRVGEDEQEGTLWEEGG